MTVEHDFVVVGAGSAGCVVAERLTRSGRHRVLVLEAGPSDNRFWVRVPLGYGKTFYDPKVNWMYQAEPDPGLAGRIDYWPRGKVLGGSSSINAMVHIRGQAADYEEWAALGNPGWGWQDVLPYFKTIEANERGEDDYRGADGPLTVSDVSDRIHPLCRAFIAAAREAGLPFNPDFNGASQEGVGIYQTTTRRGRRVSAATAFLKPAMRRGNLRVITGAQVTRVLFEARRAVGVEYASKGRREIARAGREVVLAAGAVNSPQLLQLSGIGPAAHLRANGIEVVLDNDAVGGHMQDHLGLNYSYRARRATLNTLLRPWWGKLCAGAAYLLLGRGPLALSLNQGGGFFRTRPDKPRPNLQLYFQALTTITARSGTRPLLTPDPFPGFSLGLSSCRPTSRGRIEIRSADPFAPPRIHANAYGTEHDVEEMLDGVKFLRKLASMPALAPLIEAELLPGPGCRSDEELIADIRARSGTVYHPVGTCRMGPGPNGSVVDSRLRVHGLSGLRVVDASIFPTLVSGNTNAAALMVGAKGADIILEDGRAR
jgi:choline dehydrogenase